MNTALKVGDRVVFKLNGYHWRRGMRRGTVVSVGETALEAYRRIAIATNGPEHMLLDIVRQRWDRGEEAWQAFLQTVMPCIRVDGNEHGEAFEFPCEDPDDYEIVAPNKKEI